LVAFLDQLAGKKDGLFQQEEFVRSFELFQLGQRSCRCSGYAYKVFLVIWRSAWIPIYKIKSYKLESMFSLSKLLELSMY